MVTASPYLNLTLASTTTRQSCSVAFSASSSLPVLLVARRRVGLLVVLPVLGPDGDAGHVPRAAPPRQRGGGVDLPGQDVARGAVPDLGADGGEPHLGAPAGVVGDEGEVVEAVEQAGAALHRDPRRRGVRDGEGDAGRGEADGDAGGDGHGGQRSEQQGEDGLLHIPPAPGTGSSNRHDLYTYGWMQMCNVNDDRIDRALVACCVSSCRNERTVVRE